MKRRIVLRVSLVLLFLGLIWGVIYLNNPGIFTAEDSIEEDDNNLIRQIEYKVVKGEITHTHETVGQVVSNLPELYLSEIRIDKISDVNFEMFKEKGDHISPGEVLYKYRQKDKTANFNGKVVDIIHITNEKTRSLIIRLLNYDKLYITSKVPIDKLDKINYHTDVKVIYNGKEYQGEINTIGYEIEDDMLPIELALPDRLLPGAEVEIIFILGVKKAGLYVSEEAVFQVEDSYFGILKDGDGTKEVEISVGEHFSVEEDGNTFKYVEIISGVNENDILVVEQVTGLDPKVKEKLMHE